MDKKKFCYQLVITISISEKTNAPRTNISSGDNVFCLKFLHFGSSSGFLWISGCYYGYYDHFCDWWISWVDLVWFAASNVRLHMSDFSQLFDYTFLYNCTEWLVKNEATDAPIIFEEFVMIMISSEITGDPWYLINFSMWFMNNLVIYFLLQITSFSQQVRMLVSS